MIYHGLDYRASRMDLDSDIAVRSLDTIQTDESPNFLIWSKFTTSQDI